MLDRDCGNSYGPEIAFRVLSREVKRRLLRVAAWAGTGLSLAFGPMAGQHRP